MITAIRLVQNFKGRLLGFSGCSNCGDTWNWKKGHSIKYNEHSSMFPLCEECYWKLSVKEIRQHILALITEWNRQARVYNVPTGKVDVKNVLKSAMEIVRKEKLRG